MNQRSIVVTFCFVLALANTSLPAEEATDHPSERAEIRKFFADYQQATADQTGAQLIGLYDFQTMVDEIVAQAGVELPPGMRQAMSAGIQRQIQQQLNLFNGVWYRHKVVSIKFFGSDSQAEVFVRGWNEDQETSRQIFWLDRKQNRWRIYDFMDLSMGLACTKLAAVGLKQGISGDISPDSLIALRSLLSAVVHVGQEDLDAATEAMREVEGRPIPQFVESARWFFAAAIAMIDDAEKTLEYVDKATAFQPELPLANYMRAVAYNVLGRHELAAASARKFMQRYGDDADAYYELAQALTAMDRNDEAVEQLRKALADTPNSLGNVELLGLLLPKDQKSELAEHFARLRDHSDAFQYLADTYEIEEDADALKVLIESIQQINPDEPLLDYYRAVVLAINGQHAKAMTLLDKILRNMDAEDDDRGLYEYLYFTEVIKADRLLELYQASANPQQRARELFEQAIERDEYGSLKGMLQAHVKAFPGDPDAHLMAGDIDYYQGQFDSADRHYAEGLKCQQTDVDVTKELIRSRVYCWKELDKPLEAYKEFGPQDDVFEDLISTMWYDGDQDRFAKLLDLHRQQFPASMAVARWSAVALFADEKYEAAVKILTPAITRHGDANSESSEQELGHRFAADDMLVRSLLRLEKVDQALAAAKQAFGDEEQAYFQTLVHAVSGDEAAFQKMFKICQEEFEYSEYDFIYDEDFPSGFAGLEDVTVETETSDLRSLAVLLSTPVPLGPQSITRAAAETWNRRLFREEYAELGPADQQYVCEITEEACIVSVEGFRFFIQSKPAPFLGDAEILAAECQADLSAAAGQHQGYLSIDVDVWPTADPDQAPGIPLRAQQLLGSLAVTLAGDKGTIIIDRDSGEMRKLTSDAASKLTGSNPMTAFDDVPDQPVPIEP